MAAPRTVAINEAKSVGDVGREPEVAPESTEPQTIGDQLSKGDSRRNGHNGNLRRGQPLKGVTVPKPFKLSISNRPASASRRSRDCLTFGERMVKMATKVPERFIRRPAGEPPKLVSGTYDPKPTVPQSPNLRTEARAASKQSYFKTPIGREEKELAYMKKHQFKARQYRPDGFGIGDEQGLSKNQSNKPLTRQEPFRLSTGSRPSRRNVTSQDECDISKQFKARPLPASSRPGAQFNPKFPVLRPSKAKGGNGRIVGKPESVLIAHRRLAQRRPFKARPLPASTFSPKPYPPKTGAVVTQPMEITMHSSLRARQRALWDRENEARIAAEQRERLELEAANAAIEKKKIAELRRLSTDHGGMAFKAKPIVRASKPDEEPHLPPASLTPPEDRV